MKWNLHTWALARRIAQVGSSAVLLGATLLFDRLRRGRRGAAKLRGVRYATFSSGLGGALPKLGQVLSTRADFVPPDVREGLRTLQDRVEPIPPEEISSILSAEYGEVPFDDISAHPLGSATIAQVHSAVLRDGRRPVALKIMRPLVRERLRVDCALTVRMARLLSWLPAFKSVPMNEAAATATRALLEQADFGREAQNMHRLRDSLQAHDQVVVPRVYDSLSTERVLCMELLPDMHRIGGRDTDDKATRSALTAAVQSLYHMIFTTGFVHCDLHPGNMGILADGRIALFDVGLVADLPLSTRQAFAELFLAIYEANARTAARIVKEMACFVPDDLDEAMLERELGVLLDRMGGGTRAVHFQVAEFVAELFAVQRRVGIRGTNEFTMAILALLVLEGVVKEYMPDLDFQRQAATYLLETSAEIAAEGGP